MERFAANMPVVAGLELRGNPRYPRINRWYSAMDARPAYQKVKSDDMTLNLVIRCVFTVLSLLNELSNHNSSSRSVEKCMQLWCVSRNSDATFVEVDMNGGDIPFVHNA